MDSGLASWLAQQEIKSVDESVLVCSREIVTSQGSQRNRSRINGVLVNKQQMEQLRDRLVEITAQGQTVQIGRPVLQREWLDSYGERLSFINGNGLLLRLLLFSRRPRPLKDVGNLSRNGYSSLTCLNTS